MPRLKKMSHEMITKRRRMEARKIRAMEKMQALGVTLDMVCEEEALSPAQKAALRPATKVYKISQTETGEARLSGGVISEPSAADESKAVLQGWNCPITVKCEETKHVPINDNVVMNNNSTPKVSVPAVLANLAASTSTNKFAPHRETLTCQTSGVQYVILMKSEKDDY